jgi:DNA-binding NarL/FixJ family response regulator
VVDDHGIVRDGLTALLEREADLRVVGHASTGEEAVLAAVRLRPDVVIMDLVLPDFNGIDATLRILREVPGTRIIALSARHTSQLVYRAMRAGARGYVVKAAAGTELVIAVKAVAAGRSYVSGGLIVEDSDGLAIADVPKTPYERLSSRERQVLRRIVAGATSSDIAQHLSLSTKTVDTYRGRLMLKLGLANRTALIRFVLENELIAP